MLDTEVAFIPFFAPILSVVPKAYRLSIQGPRVALLRLACFQLLAVVALLALAALAFALAIRTVGRSRGFRLRPLGTERQGSGELPLLHNLVLPRPVPAHRQT